MNPLVILAIALAVSLAGNASLGYVWLGARDDLAVSTTERDAARSTASACSDATEALRELSDKRAKEAKVVRAAAAATSKGRKQRADDILSAPASVPGNDCQSATDRSTKWLKTRK